MTNLTDCYRQTTGHARQREKAYTRPSKRKIAGLSIVLGLAIGVAACGPPKPAPHIDTGGGGSVSTYTAPSDGGNGDANYPIPTIATVPPMPICNANAPAGTPICN